MGTSAAIVVIRRAERRVVEELRAAGATSAERAVPLQDLRFVEKRRLDRLINAGVVSEAPNGYWLDESMYAGFRSDRRAIVLVILAILTTTAIGMFFAQGL